MVEVKWIKIVNSIIEIFIIDDKNVELYNCGKLGFFYVLNI